MRRTLRTSLSLLAFLAVVLWTLPAGADHPGRYTPSPESTSTNMKLLGSAPKTNPASFYRNSDLAFWGRLVFAGNYEGFRVIDVSDPEAPVVLADVNCPGQQHDVSVWRNLLFLSIDRPLTAPACGSPQTPVVDGVITPGFEGIRIFDVANPSSPRYVGAVATDCGSHTHTLVPDPDDASRVLLYVASYPASALGPTPFGTQCSRSDPGHSKISIVEVPLATPAQSRVIAQPTFELNDFGAPGFRGCHDITVFMEPRVAAAACLSEGQMWDISDLEHPRTTARLHNANVDIWHSAAFTWDNQLVVFGDEAGGGGAPFCKASDPSTVGAAWFYRVAELDNLSATAEEQPLGHFKIPRPQGDVANCTMHNFNVIPVSGRYVLVSANYSGGTSVADFTDPANASEFGHFDPHGANTWSSYWYNNFIYTNDSGRGVDVVLLSDPVRAGARKFPYLNPQTQERMLR
jgi:hypothetical protein